MGEDPSAAGPNEKNSDFRRANSEALMLRSRRKKICRSIAQFCAW